MKNRLLLMLLCFITYFTISSQTYQVTVDSAVAYTPLENSISITQGEEWDDEEYSIPLEFNINLFGDVFNTLVVDANGIVSDEGIDEYEFLSGLLVYNVDLIDRGYDTGEAQSDISYLVEGEEGDRILKIEWENAGFYEDYYINSSQSFVNIQCWINERDESIEYRYGDNLITNDNIFSYYGGGPLVGMVHNLNGDDETFDEFALLAGVPSSPILTLVKNFSELENGEFLMASPAPNTRYRFTRMDVSTNEIQDISSQFSLYPNPTSTALNLVQSADIEEVKSLSIYGNDGRLIKTIATDFSNIDVADLVSGVYQLNILTEDGLAVKRFVKIDK